MPSQWRNVFAEFSYTALTAATETLNVPELFQDLGYLDQKQVSLRVPFLFVPPTVAEVEAHVPAKPKAAPKPALKAARKQLSISSFVVKEN